MANTAATNPDVYGPTLPLGEILPWAIFGGLLLLLAGLSVAIRNAMFLAGRAPGPAPASAGSQRG